jgi:hypothetical protein
VNTNALVTAPFLPNINEFSPKDNFSQINVEPLTLVIVPLKFAVSPQVIIPEQVNEFEFGVAVTKVSAADNIAELPPLMSSEAQATFVFAGIVTFILAVVIFTVSPSPGYPLLLLLPADRVHVELEFQGPLAAAVNVP